MSIDHAFLHINGFLASTGFGIAMGLTLIPALFLAGIRPSALSIALLVITLALVCLCLAEWAQTIDLRLNVDALKTILYGGGIIAGIAAMGWLLVSIVQRIPPEALLVCFLALLGVGAFFALWLFAPFKHLVLLAFIVALLTFAAIAVVAAWALDRRDARKTQAPYRAEPPRLVPELAYVDRGQLSAPPKRLTSPQSSKLPTKRYGGDHG